MRSAFVLGLAIVGVSAGVATAANADEAQVTVVAPPTRYSPPPPPPRREVYVADPVDDPAPPRSFEDGRELYRSPLRLHLGPAALTTGRGLGPGLGAAADFGRGSVGFRLSAYWLRGEPASDPSQPSPFGDGLSQYTGELTLDFMKRGPFHPVFGMGFGVAHVSRGALSGSLGIGTGRLALEYALGLEDADVRLGVSVLGALPGPSDREVSDMKGYAIVAATLGIGF